MCRSINFYITESGSKYYYECIHLLRKTKKSNISVFSSLWVRVWSHYIVVSSFVVNDLLMTSHSYPYISLPQLFTSIWCICLLFTTEKTDLKNIIEKGSSPIERVNTQCWCFQRKMHVNSIDNKYTSFFKEYLHWVLAPSTVNNP